VNDWSNCNSTFSLLLNSTSNWIRYRHALAFVLSMKMPWSPATVAEFSPVLRKSIRSAGSAINRTVSFHFLTFIYDLHILHSIDLDLYYVSFRIVIVFFGYCNGNARLYGVPSPPKIKFDHNIQLDSLTINLANINIIFHSSTLYCVSQSLKL